MATERQIAANRLNAARSTGPKTSEGKARSRANATRHGLAGESELVEGGASAAFLDRREKWGAEYRPVGEAAGWALDRAVAASLRIELCEDAVGRVVAAARGRATLAWDQDRAVEAATILGRVGRDPVLASRQLQTTRAGAVLLVEAWCGLVARLETGEDWSEEERSRALDLLGVAVDLRSGRTVVDAGPGADSRGFRRALALEEIERLETLTEEALEPLDAVDRQAATRGATALLSKECRLVLRYERDAWRRYRESIREVRDPARSAIAATPTPAPAGRGRPEVTERPLAASSASIAEGGGKEIAESSPTRPGGGAGRESMGLEESARLDGLVRRVETGAGVGVLGGSDFLGGDSRRNEPDLTGSRVEIAVGSWGMTG